MKLLAGLSIAILLGACNARMRATEEDNLGSLRAAIGVLRAEHPEACGVEADFWQTRSEPSQSLEWEQLSDNVSIRGVKGAPITRIPDLVLNSWPKRKPSCRAFFRISRPEFLQVRTGKDNSLHAYFTVWLDCGGLCGATFNLEVKREAGVWKGSKEGLQQDGPVS